MKQSGKQTGHPGFLALEGSTSHDGGPPNASQCIWPYSPTHQVPAPCDKPPQTPSASWRLLACPTRHTPTAHMKPDPKTSQTSGEGGQDLELVPGPDILELVRKI